ncbi:hypothetical protein FCK90_14480 [Kocuria coralli]|uniref:AAA+ ATPase domain-containing protein n=1 Tax=Kocuria coralli TaxID=1461025 RepID=A0A5J5KTA8_9MICC|nr:MobF family relaxase [Kocuria coralli]KAA9393007.1 hypothetical protein FCK90_14480 [Kocuria coralli]
MTVSISKMSVQYYLEQVAIGDAATAGTGSRDLTRYYTSAGAPPGRWIGAGTAGLGMDAGTKVTARAARLLLQDSKHPETGKQLGRAPIARQQAPAGAKTAAGKTAKSDRAPVAGFDLTFSVPKSVSVLWAMADEDTKAAVHAAHRAAMDQTLSWLDERVIQTRAGHAGVAKVPTRGLIATAFDHWDSRAGDPQLHTHVVVANRVQRASDGAWVTLDSVSLHKNIVTASERFNGLLFDELARTLGTRAEIRDEATTGHGGVAMADKNARIELAGIPDDLITEFSTRTQAIEAETDRLIAQWQLDHGQRPGEADLLRIRQQATLATRTAKDTESMRSLDEKSFTWQQRAFTAGHDPQDIVAASTGLEPTITTAGDVQPETIEAVTTRVLTVVSAQRATFTRANVHAEVSRALAAVRCHSPQARDELLDTVTDRALERTVQLTPHRFHTTDEIHPGLATNTDHAFNDAGAYTTAEHLSAEQRLIAAATNTTAPAVTDVEAAEGILDEVRVGKEGHRLAEDQRAAALRIAIAPQSLVGLIGPAGTGKTTCLSALRSVWEAEHGPGSIVGLAPSAVAASVLGQEIDVPTDNVTKWLWESEGPGAQRRQEQLVQVQQQMDRLLAEVAGQPTDAQQRSFRQLNATLTQLETTADKYQMRPGQLVIVDEASMAGTQALDRLRDQAQRTGAKLLAVGDPSQLGAIDAGGMLGWIERHQHNPGVTAASLTSVWRFKNTWEASNSLALRHGDHSAIDVLVDHGRITQVEDPEDVEPAAFDQWVTARGQGSALLIAGTQDSVNRLNTQAQDLLRSQGEVDHTTTAVLADETVAGVGDRILTRRNERQVLDDRGDFIKNGDLLTVTDVRADGTLDAIRDNGATVHLPRGVLENTQLGYAATAHRCQGVTVDRAISAVDPQTTSRETFYVAMTRGAYSNTAVLPPPAAEDADTPDPWRMIREVTPKTARQQLGQVLDRTDTELTAHEVRDHAHGWDNDLARLTDELRYVGQAIATRQAVEWVTTSNGPDAVTEWANTEHWPALVNAVAEGHQLPDATPETPREALAAVRATVAVDPPTRYNGAVAIPAPGNAQELRTTNEVLDKIDARIDVLRAQTAQEPWRTHLATAQAAQVDAALIARAILNYDDLKTVLPEKPPQDLRARPAYEASRADPYSAPQGDGPAPPSADRPMVDDPATTMPGTDPRTMELRP